MIKFLRIMALSSLLIIFSGKMSEGVLLPPGPVSPTLDAPTDVTFGLKNVGTTAQSVAAQAQAVANEATSKVKSVKKKFMDKFTGFMGGLFQKKEKISLPGTKTVKETEIADIYDADSVKKAMYQLFLAYPVDCDAGPDEFKQCSDYRAKAEEFYQDTVIEIYTTVRQLEEELFTLRQEVDNLSSTFAGGTAGSDGAETGDDENGAWKNAYNAYETMDSILKITQELTAMKIQYEAAQLLRNQIKPAAYVSKEERKAKEKAAEEAKTSFNQRIKKVKLVSSGKFSHSETLMFGQIGIITQADFALKSDTTDTETTTTEEDEEEYVYDPSLYGNISFSDASPAPIDSPFAGSEDKIAELDKVTPIYEKAQEAMSVHNLLQSLDSYQEIFKNYEQYKRLHEKSVQAIAIADQCAIQYLGRRYSSPETIWKGTMPDAALNDYDARQGISGWAVKAFELAKSEEAMPVELDDLETMEINTDIDLDDANSTDALQKELEQQNNSGLKNPSQSEEIEKSTRESQMISFNIGAEAAQLLVEDQYKSNPQWGTPTNRFPIWNDQISFYNQYLTGKYENIKDYLHQYDVSTLIVDIAYPLNDLLTENASEKANNRAGLDKLASKIKEEASLANPSAVLEELENNRNELLTQAQKDKEAKITALENQKSVLLQKRDTASELLSQYNEQLNTAQENMLLAQKGIESKNKQLEYLEERRGDMDENIIKQGDITYSTESYEVSPETTTEVNTTTYQEEKGEELLYDTSSVVSEYKDKMNKLNYRAKQQNQQKINLQSTSGTSNPDGSISLYPETNQSQDTQKQNLFRRRPFSENKTYQPTSLSKYSLSRMLYFGAQYDTFNYEQEKSKLDAELDAKIGATIEYTTQQRENTVSEETQEAVTVEYRDSEKSETETLNMGDTQEMLLAKEERSNYQKEYDENNELTVSLKQQIENKEKEIEALNQQLSSLEANIENEEQNYVSQVQQIETAYNQKLAEAKEYIENKRQAKETLDLISYYKEKIGLPVAGIDGLVPPFSLLQILNIATNLTDDTKGYADQLIDDAKKSIMNLGEEVYIGAYEEEIQKIHENLMTQLEALPVEGLQNYSSSIKTYAKGASIIKPLSSMFQKMMVEEACQNDVCKQTDRDYFVGSYAKSRDFMAPKPSLKEYLPPLREIVHFDDVDSDNIAQTSDGGITKEGFLNSGSRIPEVWKLILRNKAFVDKDIDLKTLLSEGGETATFMRGGRYPCRLDDQIVDIIESSGEFTIYTSKALPLQSSGNDKQYRPADMASMPQCQGISLENGPGIIGKLYITVKDEVENVTAPAKVASFQEYSGTQTHSELGTLLQAKESGLYYNEAPQTVLSRLNQMTGEINSSNYEETMQDTVYKNALLDHNQIGNFLSFVEQEISYRQAMEELKLNVDEAKETLFEQFEKIGFEPREDYNLANQEDYDATKETLNRYKNTIITEEAEKLEGINIENNEVVEERVNKIKNIFTALSKDKEAYISITDTTDSGSEFDERLKTEEVNHQVTSEYKKRADEEFEKQINSYPIPFCAAY